jgi:3-methyladenine DNA glycosylase AlkD
VPTTTRRKISPPATTLEAARHALHQLADPVRARTQRGFFKNCTGDTFLGVPTASARKVAREFAHLPLADIRKLMGSTVHDERSLAHMILCLQFQKAGESGNEKIFNFYLRNRRFIRDWDGVDDSAPYIVGPWLLTRDKRLLYELAKSPRLWDRRIAIVSTWWFIRNGHLDDTFALAEILLYDSEDLIHKATGWMLREAGKKDLRALEEFLRRHHAVMPRTSLRYAIERFPPEKRQLYMARKTAIH